MPQDLVERLRSVARSATFADAIGSLLIEAADEIEFLRKHAGAVSRGQSFAEIAADSAVKRGPPNG